MALTGHSQTELISRRDVNIKWVDLARELGRASLALENEEEF